MVGYNINIRSASSKVADAVTKMNYSLAEIDKLSNVVAQTTFSADTGEYVERVARSQERAQAIVDSITRETGILGSSGNLP